MALRIRCIGQGIGRRIIRSGCVLDCRIGYGCGRAVGKEDRWGSIFYYLREDAA